MKHYAVWDRTSKINGVDADHFLAKMPFKNYGGDIILIYAENGTTVTNVECKGVLANIYNIDVSLPIDEFMTRYFAEIEKMNNSTET